MRTWIKVTVGVVAVAVTLFAILAGTGAYYVMRHLETRTASEAAAQPDFDAVRARFKDRAPMIEIGNIKGGEVKIQREPHPAGLRASTMHVMTWSHEENKLITTDIPLWLMRFSSVNILSRLGLAPGRFRLTAEDVMRFGPGIVVDYKQPGVNNMIVWVQ
jgi:hypothetical protein